MPAWAGKWQGGRFYLDELGRKVFFIERRVNGRMRSIRVPKVHDETLANGALAQFLDDPTCFDRAVRQATGPVFLTTERINAYLASIADAVEDHRSARLKYLHAWAALKLDLRSVDRDTLRAKLDDFEGGHRGRTEALNAFARWLVKEGTLETWRPLVNTHGTDPAKARAKREAYSLEQLRECWARLSAPVSAGWEAPPDVIKQLQAQRQAVRDVFLLRAATGMHMTEIDQLAGARKVTGPLPDQGAYVRVLPKGGPIAGVLQVMHKSRHRHRQSVDAACLEAALRLRAGVPNRSSVWKAMAPLTPSNLRHTFVTLAGECGELVEHATGGIDRARIAQAVGHRAGSTMTADRYEKLQVPAMIRLPLGFPEN